MIGRHGQTRSKSLVLVVEGPEVIRRRIANQAAKTACGSMIHELVTFGNGGMTATRAAANLDLAYPKA